MPALRAEILAGAERLRAAGIANSRAEADWLAASVLGVSRPALHTLADLDPSGAEELSELIGRRAAGEPLQYLLRTAAFRYLDLAVGPGVFIPRPETELLIELAAPALATAASVVDLGAGSGAIALAAATEYPHLQVIAVERSPQALVWLRTNVARHAARVQVLAADLADPALLAEQTSAVDVVLSNPPYVPSGLQADLPAEVAHDPEDAVFAGPDGLSVIGSVIGSAARLLRPGGLLVLEHDESHQPEVLRLLASPVWTSATGHHDLTGRPRFCSAVRGVRQDIEL